MLITSDKQSVKATIDKDTGFLTAPVTLARVGIQNYLGAELGLTDRAGDVIRVFRSPEHVFDENSITTFTNLPVTDDHPSDLVTVDNVKALQVGSVSDVKRTGSVLTGVVTITDKTIIEKITSGKVEVSVGYTNCLVKKSGVVDGMAYDYMQTDIKANHLAIVQAGRCGSACAITTDHEKGANMIITLDGIEYDVDNTQLAQAIKKQQDTFDAEKEAMKKKLEEDEEEIETLKKEKDKAEATKDAISKTVLTDEALNDLVHTRAKLLTDAALILGDKMPDCDCPREIKTTVIDHVLKIKVADEKSTDYVDAMYDVALVKSKDSKKSVDNMQKDMETGDKKLTRDSVRDEWQKSYLKVGA